MFLEFNVRDAIVAQGGREGGAEGGREDGTKAHSSTEKRNKRCAARKTKESISLDQPFSYVFLLLLHWLGGFGLRGWRGTQSSRAEGGVGRLQCKTSHENTNTRHPKGLQTLPIASNHHQACPLPRPPHIGVVSGRPRQYVWRRKGSKRENNAHANASPHLCLLASTHTATTTHHNQRLNTSHHAHNLP